MKIEPVNHLKGNIVVPGDKSISHRAVMFGAIANGKTTVHNFLQGADCLSTISCMKQLGIIVEKNNSDLVIHGKGLHGLTAPKDILDVGNSGTTLRLISGILSGQPFTSHLTGDASICKRPMNRIILPLTQMNAQIKSDSDNGCAPITIAPTNNESHHLTAISYDSKVASAQVKSCILLAGLYADKITSVTEPYISRDHSERMLQSFGCELTRHETTVSIAAEQELFGTKIIVPGDISSAAYFIVAGLIVPDSDLLIQNVGINPTRDGIIEVLRSMGADIELENIRNQDTEPVCDIHVRSSKLHQTTIEGSFIPRLIDEIPILAVAAAFAEGTTIIKDAQELKVKESNRIDVMVDQLKKMGADVTATEDGMIIRGGAPLHGAVIDSYNDHRIAMSFAIAGLACKDSTTILRDACVAISYPDFYHDLNALTH